MKVTLIGFRVTQSVLGFRVTPTGFRATPIKFTVTPRVFGV